MVPQILLAPPLPSFDGSAPFYQGMDLLIPKRPGVYLIHDIRGILYVGRSSDLRRRFTQHYWTNGNPFLALALKRPAGAMTFSWIECGEPDQAFLEAHLIEAYQPPCNRSGLGKEH